MEDDSELAAILRLDLREVLAKDGYVVIEQESTKDLKTSVKMSGPRDSLILKLRSDDVWVYFNVNDNADHGTIIEYMKRRRGFTVGHVRKHFRPHGGRLLPQLPRGGSRPVAAAPRDLSQVAARWVAARSVWGLPHYLEGRGLSAATVAAYASALRMDRRGNILFGHTNDAGQIVGYEIKGPSAPQLFAKGGIRLLCRLGPLDGGEPAKIALTESGVDALSLAQLVGRRDALFLSTGGALSVHTLNTIKATVARFPAAEILLAFDNDDGGQAFAAQVEKALGERSGVRRLLPKAKDWNDDLRARQAQAAKPAAPSP